MGTVHARNALGLEEVTLVAVASTRPDRAQELARELGVNAATYDELLARDDVDAVVVAARSIDHARWGTAVLEAGKHLFLEKPGATSLAGHDALVAAAAAQPNAVVQVGYHRRFDARWRQAARLVADGAVGGPLAGFGAARGGGAPRPQEPPPAGGLL